MAEKKINGRVFQTAPLLATQAIVLQARLLRLVGPAMSQLGAVFKKDSTTEGDAPANAAALAAFASIFVDVDPEAFAKLVKDVVEIAQIKRPSGAYDGVDFDGDMSGEYLKDIMPVALFVLGEQFGDFFTGLPGLGSLGLRKVG